MKSLLPMIAFYAVLASHPLYGADILPVGPLDASENAYGASPIALPKGGIMPRLSTEAMEHVDVTKGDDAAQARIKSIHRTNLLLGLGVSRRLSVTIGLVGTREDLSSGARDALFKRGDQEPDAAESGLVTSTPNTGFAGASLAVKWNLINRAETDGLSLAIMPFLESGAGEKATYGVSRSVEPKGGATLLAALGSKAGGELATQLGIRYRSPEAISRNYLRHEIFYRASASFPLAAGLSLFGEGEGRELMIAPFDQNEGKSRTYQKSYGGMGRIGVAFDFADATIGVFGGRRLGPANGIGFASRSFGASISFALGKASRASRPLSYAKEIEREQGRKANLIKAPLPRVQTVQDEQGAYPEMIGDEIDPLEILGPGEAPDFKDVRKRMEEERRSRGVEAEDDRIERELRELKEAEAKASIEREKEKAKDDAEARQEAQERMAEDAENLKKWVDEANEELKEIDGIKKEDLEWNGLEGP